MRDDAGTAITSLFVVGRGTRGILILDLLDVVIATEGRVSFRTTSRGIRRGIRCSSVNVWVTLCFAGFFGGG